MLSGCCYVDDLVVQTGPQSRNQLEGSFGVGGQFYWLTGLGVYRSSR
jgi:hypothetical protein